MSDSGNVRREIENVRGEVVVQLLVLEKIYLSV